jgi:endonuclease G
MIACFIIFRKSILNINFKSKGFCQLVLLIASLFILHGLWFLKSWYKFLAIFLFLLLSTNSSNIRYEDFYRYGNPCEKIIRGKINYVDQYLCRDGYISAYSYSLKIPVVVIYLLENKSIKVNFKRKKNFQSDIDVPLYARAKSSDYLHSGYDRGHNAPFSGLKFSHKSANQSFLLTNIAPQNADLNRRGWAKLERNILKWRNNYGRLWIYGGGFFKNGKVHITIGNSKVAVPDYFFKVIYAPNKSTGNKTIAFIMPNQKVNAKEIEKYIVTVKEIEEKTDLTFFTSLPNDQRKQLISAISPMWAKYNPHNHRSQDTTGHIIDLSSESL